MEKSYPKFAIICIKSCICRFAKGYSGAGANEKEPSDDIIMKVES